MESVRDLNMDADEMQVVLSASNYSPIGHDKFSSPK